MLLMAATASQSGLLVISVSSRILTRGSSPDLAQGYQIRDTAASLPVVWSPERVGVRQPALRQIEILQERDAEIPIALIRFEQPISGSRTAYEYLWPCERLVAFK